MIAKKLSSVLMSASSGAILIYYVSLLFMKSDEARSDSVGIGGSVLLTFLEAVALLLLILTVLGVLKTKVPSIIFSFMNIGVACLGLISLLYVSAEEGTPFSEYYGTVFSMAGLLLYFVSTILVVLSIGRKEAKVNEIAAEPKLI